MAVFAYQRRILLTAVLAMAASPACAASAYTVSLTLTPAAAVAMDARHEVLEVSATYTSATYTSATYTSATYTSAASSAAPGSAGGAILGHEAVVVGSTSSLIPMAGPPTDGSDAGSPRVRIDVQARRSGVRDEEALGCFGFDGDLASAQSGRIELVCMAKSEIVAAASSPAIDRPALDEMAVWRMTERSQDAAKFREFLRIFPHSVFVPLARRKLAELEEHHDDCWRYRCRASQGVVAGSLFGGIMSPLMGLGINRHDRGFDEPHALLDRPASRSVYDTSAAIASGQNIVAWADPIAAPEFPWPPPRPSEEMNLPRAVLLSGLSPKASLGAVGGRLTAALQSVGYSEYSFFRAPGGFAPVARLERFKPDDGSPWSPDQRFVDPNTNPPFSFTHWFRCLFFAPDGYYRLIVFVVSDRAFVATGKPPAEPVAAAWLRSGANALPAAYDAIPFGPNRQITALIYEFHKHGSATVDTLLPGQLDARTHLEKSGLYSRLLGDRRPPP